MHRLTNQIMAKRRNATKGLKSSSSKIAVTYSQVKEKLAHWPHWRLDQLVPRKHFFAATGLMAALGLILMVPDSSDASSGRTVINLSTGESYQAASTSLMAVPAADSEKPQVLPDFQGELLTVLEETELSLRSPEIPDLDDSPTVNAQNLTPVVTEAEMMAARQEAQNSYSNDPRLILEVESGDSLSKLFWKADLTDRDIYEISQGNESEKRVLTRIYPGYKLAFDIQNDELQSLEIITSELESYVFKRTPGTSNYTVAHNIRNPELRQTYKQAVIEDSLFLAAQKGGIPAALTMEMADIYGGVIDFMLDTRSGDSFTVLYEEKYLDDKFVGNGKILAASFTNQGVTHTALRYVDTEGYADYFNPEGESMRKAFLKNPVDFVRISSDFNPNRRHPILNTIRAHRGTDYAAPSGTPIVATSDGKVTWAARNGSFGNLVVIQHSDRFETKYAHLSKFANGIRSGSRVTQGQTIGYVGSTGSATGPHLHFEFLMDGVHRNWRTIQNQLPKAESIAADQLPRFRDQTNFIAARLQSLENPAIAMLENQDNQ